MRSLSYALPPPPHSRQNPSPSHEAKVQPCALPFPDALRAAAAAAAISLSLLAGDAASAVVTAAAVPPPEICCDGGAAREAEVRADAVTNEQLVEEAWEVVNEGFLPDAGSRPWSREFWMLSLSCCNVIKHGVFSGSTAYLKSRKGSNMFFKAQSNPDLEPMTSFGKC